MTPPHADAIVVAYRSAAVLGPCLRSLRADPAVGRIIVVDNSCAEDGRAVVEGLERVLYVESATNVGFGRAINSVRDRVETDYVVLANPDTTQSDHTVGKSIGFLERHQRAALVGPRMLYPDGSLCRNSQHFVSLVRMIATSLGRPERLGVARRAAEHERAHRTEYVIGSFVTCRRAALDQVGWFDESIFLFGEDQDLCRRLGQAGWEIWYAPIGEVVHRPGHSWRQLDDQGRELFLRARTRELKRQRRHVAAALYVALERSRRRLRREVDDERAAASDRR
jgi:GT2 family glycosyltransferase